MADHEEAEDGGGASATFMAFASPIALLIVYIVLLALGV